MNNSELAVHFFLQITVILFACRIVGVVASWIGQPKVVAEMIAGILLGPSLFGLFWPEWQQALFPWDKTQLTRETQSYLYPVSQLGLALYMFVVGMEFRLDMVRKHFKSCVAVSVAGMIAPFVLGAGLAWVLFSQTKLFPERTTLFEAMLFLGASMCITAFPVLARILQYKGLTNSLMGTVAIGAGAINDALSWCLLAVVIASVDGSFSSAAWCIGGGIGIVAFAIIVIRPLLTKLQLWLTNRDDELSEFGSVLGLGCLTLGAWFTEMIHLHAVFGAFIVGAVMPRGVVSKGLIKQIQPLTVALLLPLYFTFSGLNTKMGLLNSPYLWSVCGLVLGAAIVGKAVACWLAARATGISNRESLGIGTLMNARGLMELIIINIGLQRGIISEELFAILVVMAVVTTLMTSQVFDLLVDGLNRRA